MKESISQEKQNHYVKRITIGKLIFTSIINKFI